MPIDLEPVYPSAGQHLTVSDGEFVGAASQDIKHIAEDRRWHGSNGQEKDKLRMKSNGFAMSRILRYSEALYVNVVGLAWLRDLIEHIAIEGKQIASPADILYCGARD